MAQDQSAELSAAAIAAHQAGKLDEAETLYRRLLRRSPDDAGLHYNHGLALLQLGRPDAAIAAWRQCLRAAPDHLAALNNLGNALALQDRDRDALPYLRRGVTVAPERPESYHNLAVVALALEELALAERLNARALRLQPDYADALNSQGILRQRAGDWGGAEQSYRAALRHQPQFAKAHFNLGLALLAQGRMAEGWAEHEWRWRGGARSLRSRGFRQAKWDGSPLPGGRLLLHAEQGFGDTLQFLRFLPLVPAATQCRTIIVELPAPLLRLAQAMAPQIQWVASGDRLPAFDRHLPLMSLAHRLSITEHTLPAAPYLTVAPDWRQRWRQRFADLPGRKIGIVWSGDPRPQDAKAQAIDRRRSVPLARWAPLLDLAGPSCSFVSLQKGAPRRQLAESGMAGRLRDVADGLTDFAETAAAMMELDLVLTVDTAAAHLAGALGRPVWILSRFDHCWRWQAGRDDSPWYAAARLFRQPSPGDWEPVIAAVRSALLLLCEIGER